MFILSFTSACLPKNAEIVFSASEEKLYEIVGYIFAVSIASGCGQSLIAIREFDESGIQKLLDQFAMLYCI